MYGTCHKLINKAEKVTDDEITLLSKLTGNIFSLKVQSMCNNFCNDFRKTPESLRTNYPPIDTYRKSSIKRLPPTKRRL